MNGLVYFDQFDRLTGKQLGLVIVGIIILLIGVGAVSTQDDTDEGEPAGGITDGDWMVAEAVASSPPVTPGLSHRSTAYITSPRRSVTEADGDEADNIWLFSGQRSRRTVSSPSAFSVEAARTALEFVTEEERLPTQSETSRTHERDRSTSSRIRTLSESTQPLLLRSPPISPPRRRGTRRGTLRTSGIGTAGDQEGDGGGDGALPPQLPGFSIGLSPLSPGFSLIPRQRESAASNGHDRENGGADSSLLGGADGVERRSRGRRWSNIKNAVEGLAGWRSR